MNYIKRDLEKEIISLSNEYPCILITGPRGNGAIICMRLKLSALNSENYIVPVWLI